MRRIEAGIVEGSISGGMSSSGYTASFEWTEPEETKKLAIRTFPFNANGSPYLENGIITVHTDERMSGLPLRLDLLKVEYVNPPNERLLSNFLGKMAVDLIMKSYLENEILDNEHIVISTQESRIMMVREHTFFWQPKSYR